MFSENVYENHLRSQTHINNLKKTNVAWIRCETSNVEIRYTIWHKHVKSKKHLVNEGRLGPSGSDGHPKTVPSLKDLAISNLNDNNMSVQGNFPPINPFFNWS